VIRLAQTQPKWEAGDELIIAKTHFAQEWVIAEKERKGKVSRFQGTMAQSELHMCYLFHTSTKRGFTSRRGDAQDERSRLAWIGDKVETGALNAK
jgi:hypothetical protein